MASGTSSRGHGAAWRIAALYAVLAVAWVLFSDRLLLELGLDRDALARWETIKGLGFIAITAIALYFLVRSATSRLESTLSTLSESEERYRRAMLNSREAAWEWSPDSDRIYLTPGARDLLGLPPDVSIETRDEWASHVHQADRDDVSAKSRALFSGESDECEMIYRFRKGDSHIWLMARARWVGKGIDGAGRIVGTITDVSALREREEQVHAINRAFRAMMTATASVIEAHTSDRVFDSVVEALTGEDGFALAWIALIDDTPEKTVRVVAAAGLAPDVARRLKLTAGGDSHGRGPTGVAVRTGKACKVDKMRNNPDYAPWHDLIVQFDIDSEIAVPIQVSAPTGSQTIGALAVLGTTHRPIGSFEVSVLENLSRSIGYALEAIDRRDSLAVTEHARKSAIEQLTAALTGVIESFTRVMERRDPYTAGHQEKVANLSVAIARGLKWDEDRILGLKMAALLHDIGKIGVPQEILSKPSKLSEPEFALIHEHAAAGYEIVRNIDFPWPVARVVLEHHEAWDGSGYPNGLKGTSICPEARVVAVADVVDAVCTHRPYRAALGVNAALDILRQDQGAKYDPDIAGVCIGLLKRHGYPVLSSAPIPDNLPN